MHPITDTIRNIERLQKALGWNDNDFSTRLGIDASCVSKWKCGRTVPRKTSLQKISSLVGCAPGLFDRYLSDREIALMALAVTGKPSNEDQQKGNPEKGHGDAVQPELFVTSARKDVPGTSDISTSEGLSISVSFNISAGKLGQTLEALRLLGQAVLA